MENGVITDVELRQWIKEAVHEALENIPEYRTKEIMTEVVKLNPNEKCIFEIELGDMSMEDVVVACNNLKNMLINQLYLPEDSFVVVPTKFGVGHLTATTIDDSEFKLK